MSSVPSKVPFRVWYAPAFPLDAIDYDRRDKSDRVVMRMALAENIRRNGLINPLIVLNHPRKGKPLWLMVGQNRLWAMKHLGWTAAPAVVTGSCPYPATELETWDAVCAAFRDGVPYLSGWGIALRGTTPPEEYRYPCP